LNSDFFKQFKEFFSAERIKFNQKLLIFLFFLFLSTVFWFLNALNRESIAYISYPIKYVNFPEDKVLLNDVPSNLSLQVKSDGYNILKNKLSTPSVPVVLNVRSSYLHKANDTSAAPNKYYILTNVIKDEIANQIGSESELLDISPDSLIFQFGDIVHKKFKVKPCVSVETKQQYMLQSKVRAKPESVIVYGPTFILDTLSHINTECKAYKNINETISKEIPLKRINYLRYEPEKVTVTIPVEQYTEANLKIPIYIRNLPDSLSIKTFPENINVSYLVGLSNYDRVNQTMFRAEINFDSIITNAQSQVAVSLNEKPNFVRLVDYHPKRVEFIIEEK